MSFRNILFPTDFTPHARSALKYAAAFAREGRGRVVLFSVQTGSVPANLMTLPAHVLEDQDNHWLQQLRGQVKELLTDPLFDRLEVEPVIVAGEPAHEIANAVRDYEIDLVTVVTHGRRGLARALWGSTAEEIIAEAPCPVLTIRPPQRDFVEHRGHDTEINLNRILLLSSIIDRRNESGARVGGGHESRIARGLRDRRLLRTNLSHVSRRRARGSFTDAGGSV